MTSRFFARAIAAALSGGALVAATIVAARAGIEDYAFEPTRTDIAQGEAVLSVRLVDRRSGRPVPDAVIFARRLDMAPDGMETMTEKVEPLPSTEPGIYRFRTTLPMAGNWRLSLAAKVQGEAGTVENRIVFRAVR